jgi:hypothetical protein
MAAATYYASQLDIVAVLCFEDCQPTALPFMSCPELCEFRKKLKILF